MFRYFKLPAIGPLHEMIEALVGRSDTSDNTVDMFESSANRDMSVLMSKL